MIQIEREVTRLLIFMLLSFLGIALAASYWAIIGQDSILNREDNPRLVEAEARIQRGSLYDRNGQLLAQTVSDEAGRLQRQYHYPETSAFTGYFSLRYGTGGAESAYDADLRGDTLPDTVAQHFETDALHRAVRGNDVRLTLNLAVQQTLVNQMATMNGAAVVMRVPDGALLALVSQPHYDPNTLDENRDSLIDTPGNPFFNRVLQGSYQPGGLLQTPLMAVALLTDNARTDPIPDATAPVVLQDQTRLTCAIQPPQKTLTLEQAYAYGCPQPFAQIAGSTGSSALLNIFNSFRLAQPVTLPGFITQMPDDVSLTPEVTPETTPEASDNILNEALGQGNLTISPMNMVSIAAAVINGGNAPQPHAIQAIRPPDSDTWQTVRVDRPPVGLMTADTARQLNLLMQGTLTQPGIDLAFPEGLIAGGHMAQAIAGDDSQAWFIGFTRAPDGTGYAIAVVLENNDDVLEAGEIARETLLTAIETTQEDAAAG